VEFSENNISRVLLRSLLILRLDSPDCRLVIERKNAYLLPSVCWVSLR